MSHQIKFVTHDLTSGPGSKKKRAMNDKLSQSTATIDKNPASGDYSNPPSREAYPHKIIPTSLQNDEFTHVNGMGGEADASRSPSIILDTEPQLHDDAQKNSKTATFEQWLGERKDSSEQPQTFKRAQQPTPDYDSEIKRGRCKRARLAGEVCQSVFPARDTAAGNEQEERNSESDAEDQATTQRLASPIAFDSDSKPRHTAIASPDTRTRSDIDTSPDHQRTRHIEPQSAISCTQVMSSALTGVLPPLSGKSLEGRTRTPSTCRPDGADRNQSTISNNQVAVQSSSPDERRMATQEQASTWDQQAADMARQPAILEQLAAYMKQQIAALEKRTADLDERASTLDKQAAEFVERVSKRNAELDERASTLDKRAAVLDQLAADFAAEMKQRDEVLCSRAAVLDQRASTLDARARNTDQPVPYSSKRARSPSLPPSPASYRTTIRRHQPDIHPDLEESDYYGSEDGASDRAAEEEIPQPVKAPHHQYKRGPFSQKDKGLLRQWKKEGKTHQWIAQQLKRRPDYILGLMK